MFLSRTAAGIVAGEVRSSLYIMHFQPQFPFRIILFICNPDESLSRPSNERITSEMNHDCYQHNCRLHTSLNFIWILSKCWLTALATLFPSKGSAS